MIEFVAKIWMKIKRHRSKGMAKSSLKSPLPVLTDVSSIARYVTQELTYTGDPILGGLNDFYQHPEHLQWSIESKVSLPVDCDDYSVLAFAMAKQNADMKPEMVVLLMASLWEMAKLAFKALISLKVPYFPFHEGCFIEVGGKLWFVDTNGLWDINSKEEVIKIFQEAWGVQFKFIETSYPF